MILNIGKNNVKLKREKQVEKRQFKFGIRKFSVGVASVLLGSLLFFGSVDVTPQGVSLGTGTTVNAAEGDVLATGKDGVSKIYEGILNNVNPKLPTVVMYVNVSSLSGKQETFDSLSYLVRGVETGGDGVNKYTQNVSSPASSTKLYSYTIVSKLSNGQNYAEGLKYALKNANISNVSLNSNPDLFAYVTNVYTGDGGANTKYMDLIVAQKPKVNDGVKVYVPQNGNLPDAKQFISNSSDLKNVTYSWSDIDTSKTGEHTAQIVVSYAKKGSESASYGLDAISKSVPITVVVEDSEVTKTRNDIENLIKSLPNLTDEHRQQLLKELSDANTVEAIKGVGEKATVQDLSDAKDAANLAIDAMENLSDTDKQQYKDKVNAATTTDDVTAAKTEAETLNNQKGDINSKIDALPNLSPEEKQSFKNKVKEAATPEEMDKSLLDAQKSDAKYSIDQLENLSDKDKKAAKEAVDAATDEAGVKTAKDSALLLDNAKATTNKHIDDLENLTPEDKARLKDEVANAGSTGELITIRKKADDLNNSKGTAIDEINKLPNLTDEDKQRAISEVKAAPTTDDVTNALTKAQTLDTAKADANKAIDEMSNLSDADKAAAKEAVKNATDEVGATTAKKAANSLDEKKGDAKTQIDAMPNLTDEEKAQAKGAVDQATDEAGVDAAVLAAKKADANKAIDAMENLSDADKEKAKEAVANADTVRGVDEAVAAAGLLDQQKSDAYQAIDSKAYLSEEDKKVAKDKVKNAADKDGIDRAVKAASDLNDAKEEANKAIDAMPNLSDADKAAAKEAVKNATNEAGVTAAKDAAQSLNDAKEEANKAIDAMPNLSDADKAAAKEAVKNATNEAGVTAAKNVAQSLNDAKEKANKAIDAMPNLTDADKAAAKEAVKNATNEAGVTAAKNVAQSLNDAKEKANKAIDAMPNLTDADKAAAKEAVKNATNEAGVTAAKDAAQSLNDAKEEANKAIDAMPNLSDADKAAAKEAVKNATNEAGVTAAKNVAQSLNDAKEKANKAIDAMSYLSDADKAAAKDAVAQATDEKGVKKAQGDATTLNQTKKQAQEAILNAEYLNDAQKAALQDELKAATTSDAAKAVQTKAQELDAKMKALNEAIAQTKEAVTQKELENATPESQKAYQEALTNAETLADKAKGSNQDAENVQKVIDALTNVTKKVEAEAKAAEEALNQAKKEAIEAINAMEDLTPEQKQQAINQVNQAQTLSAVNEAREDAQALNDAMKELKAQVAKDPTIQASDNYNQATPELKKNYEDALKVANDLLGNPDATPAQLSKAANDLAQAAQALDGVKNIAKDALQKEVDKAPQVQTSQNYDAASQPKKEAYQNALDEAKGLLGSADATPEQLAKAKDALAKAASELDGLRNNAKDALQAEANKSKHVLPSENYTSADKGKQKAYDTALENAKQVLANPDATTEDYLKAKQDLIDATNALNGQINDAKKALEQEINKEASVAADPNYQNADQPKKDTYDTVLKTAKAVFKDPNATAEQVNQARQALVDATNALNGLVNDAKTALQKEVAKQAQVKADPNYISADEPLRNKYDTTLENAENLLKDSNATPEQLHEARQALEKATNALNGLNKLSKEALEKEVAKEEAVKDSVSYQKADKEPKDKYDEALKAAQKALKDGNKTSSEYLAAQKALEEAEKALNGQEKAAREALQAEVDKAPVVKVSPNYRNATTEQVDTYNEALDAANAVLANPDATAAELLKAKQDLEEARNDLQGLQALNNAKDAANKAIDALTHLNDAQKAAVKAQVNASTQVSEINNLVKQATKLDDKMAELNQAIADSKASVTQNDLDNATPEHQQAYLDALQAAQALAAKPTGENKDQAATQTVIDNLKLALANVKADSEAAQKALNDAKQKAVAEINALPHLTEAQKEYAITRVNAANTTTEINDALQAAKDLDTAKASLMAQVDNAGTLRLTNNYAFAGQEAKNGFETAMASSNFQLDTAYVQSSTILNELQKLKEAEAKLDGDRQLALSALKAEVAKKDQILPDENYLNASDNKKKPYGAALKAAQDALTDPSKTPSDLLNLKANLAAAANALDGKVNDLRKALEHEVAKEQAVKQDPNYQVANGQAQSNYDNSLQAAKNTLDNSNATAQDLQKAKDDLVAKTNALDGLKHLAYQALQAQVKMAKQIQASPQYTLASDGLPKALNDLLTASETLLSQTDATAAQMQEKTDALRKAMANLDGLRNQAKAALKRELDKKPAVLSGPNFLLADQEKQNKYTEALKAAQAIYGKADATVRELDDARVALQNARENLNGAAKLDHVKRVAIEKIKAYKYLNKAQKEGFIAKVQQATDEAIAANIANLDAGLVNNLMGELQATIADTEVAKVKGSIAYKNASAAKRKAYDEVLAKAQALVDYEKGAFLDAQSIEDLLKAYDGAVEALDGQPIKPTQPKKDTDKLTKSGSSSNKQTSGANGQKALPKAGSETGRFEALGAALLTLGASVTAMARRKKD